MSVISARFSGTFTDARPGLGQTTFGRVHSGGCSPNVGTRQLTGTGSTAPRATSPALAAPDPPAVNVPGRVAEPSADTAVTTNTDEARTPTTLRLSRPTATPPNRCRRPRAQLTPAPGQRRPDTPRCRGRDQRGAQWGHPCRAAGSRTCRSRPGSTSRGPHDEKAELGHRRVTASPQGRDRHLTA